MEQELVSWNVGIICIKAGLHQGSSQYILKNWHDGLKRSINKVDVDMYFSLQDNINSKWNMASLLKQHRQQ